MYPLSAHFNRLLLNLSPPQDRLDLARDLPPLVRDYLEQHSALKTLKPHSRLVGSYAQSLSVGDVKDVDFLVFVNDLGQGLGKDPVETLNDLKSAVDELPEYLEYAGHSAFDITKNRRSVTVVFEDEPFHLDVVPCIAPNGVDKPIYVPDRGFEDWIESDPIGVVNLLTTLTNEHGNMPRQLFKLLKHFRRTQMIYMRPKSYWLLAMGIREIQAGTVDCNKGVAQCIHDLLEAIYSRYQSTLDYGTTAPKIPDPMLGHDVAHSWKRHDFEAWMARVSDGITWSEEALETDDKDRAIELWGKVFGEEFPEEIEEEARLLAHSIRPGASSITASGLIIPRSQGEGTTPVRDTRFYGKE